MKRLLILSALITMIVQCGIISQTVVAQTLTQTIKGRVFDAHTQESLPGASIIIVDSDPLMGTTTNIEGYFSIRNALLGRQSLRISYIGFETVIVSEILVTSGKQIVLSIGLQPALAQMDEIIVTPTLRKDTPINPHATVSARSFSVEETRRYAGGLDDPARMVSAFAGVSVGNIQDNAIIVRGNSPKGVSWRLEGVEIPTPHHFAGGNVSGGGIVTLFSSQILANSDFHTSAFPAEYGNALAGVFDMNFRSGNFDTYEHTFQMGTLGLDFASEGPLSASSNASYVFNYRYSTLGLLTDLALVPSDQVFKYQDLSFKFHFPSTSLGTLSFWGIGGLDYSTEPLETDSTLWETDWDRVRYDWNIALGATGLTHTRLLGKQTTVTTTLAATGMRNHMETERQDDALVPRPDLFVKDQSGQISFRTMVQHRFNSSHFNTTGMTYKRYLYHLDIESTINSQPETYRSVADQTGATDAFEFFTQSSIELSPSVSINLGINASYLALINDIAFDPRAGIQWKLGENHRFSGGYGKHSQMEELKIYFVEAMMGDEIRHPNTSLDYAHAHHFVLAYDWTIRPHLRLKIEPYFQVLYDVPGSPNGTFSMINFKQEWAFSEVLENNTQGRNIGIDVTFERFLKNDFYYLITGSLIRSTYKADDGIWRNSRFNKSFVANILVGKEFSYKNNRKVLGINARLNLVGGERVSPVLETQSNQEKRAIFDESRAFRNQLPATVNTDLTITYRTNRQRYSSVWAFQIKNILGESMPEGYDYNFRSRSVQLEESVVVIPSISYSVEF